MYLFNQVLKGWKHRVGAYTGILQEPNQNIQPLAFFLSFLQFLDFVFLEFGRYRQQIKINLSRLQIRIQIW